MSMGWPYRSAAITGGLFIAGCGGSPGVPDDTQPMGDGYVHYDVPEVTVQPAQSAMWLQWIAAPFDHEQNLVDLVATQQQGGHHAILYSTSDIQPVGTTRLMTNADQLDIQFLGGVGGEGGQPIKLPDGVYFRLPAGRALVAQTHYVNATRNPIIGKTSLAIKFASPHDGDLIASMFVNTSVTLKVAPNADTQLDVTCAIKKDVPLVMYANHMHEMGTSITTTLTTPPSGPAFFKVNPIWNAEWTYNPDYSFATAATPAVLPSGSTVTTRCHWRNTSDRLLGMPDEMCLFIGFFLGPKDIRCVDGTWSE
jgi:hypothetical protein